MNHRKLTVLACLTFTPFSVFAQSSGFVTHVDMSNSQPVASRYVIPNMQSIDIIISAGKNAFAINYGANKVAFFDGKTWGSAINPTTKKYDMDFHLAYPTTEKNDEAWIDDGSTLYHFDGNKWLSAGSKMSLLNVTDTSQWSSWITTIDGYAYLVGSHKGNNSGSEVRFAIYNPTTQQWAKPVIIKGYHVIDDSFGKSNSDDKYPANLIGFYSSNAAHVMTTITKSNASNATAELLQINADTTYQTITPSVPNEFKYATLATDNSNVYNFSVVQNDPTYALKLFAKNPLNSFLWNSFQIPTFTTKGSELDGLLFSRDNVNKGLVCLDFNLGHTLKISCLHPYAQQIKWSPVVQLTSQLNGDVGYLRSTTKSGAWFSFQRRGSYNPKILFVDANSNKLNVINTHFGKISHHLSTIRPLDDKKVVACVTPKDRKITTMAQLYSYDLSEKKPIWHKLSVNIPLTNSNSDDCFMFPSYNGLHKNDFWVFDEDWLANKATHSKQSLKRLSRK